MYSRLVDAAAEVLLGGGCPGCRGPGLGLCRSCRAVLARLRPSPVVRPLASLPSCWAGGPYHDPLRGAVVTCKERGGLTLVPFLADLLAGAVRALDPDGSAPLVLVPVPTASTHVRERGFDVTHQLAAAAARRLGKSVRVERALELVRQPLDQGGLSQAQRWQNLLGTQRTRAAPRSRAVRVVVVDDVITTGSTMREAVRALGAGGWPVTGCAAVAQVPLRYLRDASTDSSAPM